MRERCELQWVKAKWANDQNVVKIDAFSLLTTEEVQEEEEDGVKERNNNNNNNCCCCRVFGMAY